MQIRGGFFNGTRFGLNSEIIYRVQPYGNLAIEASYNRIMLPEPYNNADFMLIGPRLDLTFTEKLFLTTFIQYNNQIDNLNVNMRFQWQFAPVFDHFFVYTENEFSGNFQTRTRGGVIMFAYWIN